MAIKKAIYHVDNGTDFDEIHFKTSASQVYAEDGTDIESSISSLQTKVNNGQNYKITNYDGSSLVLDEHTDLDTVIKTGFYIGHNLKNSPNYTYANWYHLDVRGNSTICLQTITQAVYGARGQQFIRALYDGSWSEWREL